MAFYHQVLDGQIISSIVENTSDTQFNSEMSLFYGKSKVEILYMLNFLNEIFCTDIRYDEVRSREKKNFILSNFEKIIDSFYDIKKIGDINTFIGKIFTSNIREKKVCKIVDFNGKIIYVKFFLMDSDTNEVALIDGEPILLHEISMFSKMAFFRYFKEGDI